jgi:hypothetical protein
VWLLEDFVRALRANEQKLRLVKKVGKGLRHPEEFNASFQPANATSDLTWGFAPGYRISGLQLGTLHTVAASPFS